jgi:phosphoglycerol transferase MdoB-like AlkP superfamily enzyme
MYSNAVRTDRGLAAILSGFPVLTSMNILAYAEKTSRLPFVTHSLIREGYHTSFTYGGEIDFANMRSYLINGGFARIRSNEDYPFSQRFSKWGIPDHIMFEHFYEELVNEEEPFFKVLLTLSNHEPFELPEKPKFGNQDPVTGFYSTAFYTDSCLGNFVQKVKKSDIWDDLLIIIVADHGSRLPGYSADYEEKKFHIPVLWIGGAVKQDTVVAKYGSQADLAVTLLRQMNITTDEFILGKDMLSPSSGSFAFYSYKDGLGMLTDTAGFGLNFTLGRQDFSYGNVNDSLTDFAKALQQYMFDRYIGLSDIPGPVKQPASE